MRRLRADSGSSRVTRVAIVFVLEKCTGVRINLWRWRVAVNKEHVILGHRSATDFCEQVGYPLDITLRVVAFAMPASIGTVAYGLVLRELLKEPVHGRNRGIHGAERNVRSEERRE